ncbi:MAG: hypothetical protein R3309_04955 [Reinekea sp.]|nr:hypothetical protein [Reinekea sp.]
MNVKELALAPGRIAPIGKGRYFRVFSASYPVKIRTYGAEGESQESAVLANTGAEFATFSSAEITSEYTQNVIIAYSMLPIYDNRLGVDENTLLRVDGNRTATGLPELEASSAGEVLTVPANLERKSLVIQAGATNAGKIWAGATAANVGLPLAATDTLTIEVKEAFTLFATNANDKVHLLEVI